jgi:hypothetical protein
MIAKQNQLHIPAQNGFQNPPLLQSCQCLWWKPYIWRKCDFHVFNPVNHIRTDYIQITSKISIDQWHQDMKVADDRKTLTSSEEMWQRGCPEVAAPMYCAEGSYQPT